MTIERAALGLLVVLAVLMGVNLLSAADRFTVAQEAYDGLTFKLEQFDYDDAGDPVDIRLTTANPVDQMIELDAFELTILANSHSVGGAQHRPDQPIGPNEAHTFRMNGRLNDVTYMEEIESGSTIRWLVLARAQVQVDPDLDPTWIVFSFRTESDAP